MICKSWRGLTFYVKNLESFIWLSFSYVSMIYFDVMVVDSVVHFKTLQFSKW